MSKLTCDIVEVIAIDYLKYNNYADGTIEIMKKVLRYFNRYLLNMTGIKDYRDVKEVYYYGFIKYVKKNSKKKELSKETLKGYSGVLRQIFKILDEEEKILVNPFGDVEAIKSPKNIRDKILTEEEMRLLLNSIDIDTPIGFRDRAILELLYGTGIRARELFNLELQDFIKDEKMIFIHQGKGRKDRILPLGHNTYDCLLKYVERIRPRLVSRKNIKNIFVNTELKKLNNDNLKIILKRAILKAGFKKGVCPHMIRHTFSTHLLNNGADIREVQVLLGHSSLKATEVYLNLTSYHLKKYYEKYHPLENEIYFDVCSRESYIFNEEFKEGIKPMSKKTLTGGE